MADYFASEDTVIGDAPGAPLDVCRALSARYHIEVVGPPRQASRQAA